MRGCTSFAEADLTPVYARHPLTFRPCRKCLMLLLHQKAFGPVGADPGGQQNRNAARQQVGGRRGGANAAVGISPLISWGAMERIYPRYPTIESIDLSDAERRMWMDLRPYVNTAPYVINGECCFGDVVSQSSA